MAVDTAAVRAVLAARRAELADTLERMTRIPKDATPAISFGKRIGDGTNEAIERLNMVSAATSIEMSIADVDRALAKLDEGTYGICDVCGEPIAPERLEAIPWSAVCVRDAAKRS